jgi:methionyl-tRNA formyltransferase
MNGEPVTGVSIFQIASKVDTGAILKQKEIPILADDNYLSLSTRLCETGAGMIIDTLNELESGKSVAKIQDSSQASRAPKISKKITVINWSWPAEKIHNWVRGLAPHPGMITIINSKQLRIYKTSIRETSVKSRPGTVVFKSKNELQVSTGDGALALIEIQLEGKKRMAMELFLRGFPIEEGDVLG